MPTGTERLPAFIRENYELGEWKHACAILETDFPSEYANVVNVLTDFRVPKSSLIAGGGGKTRIAQAVDAAFSGRNWREKKFNTSVIVDGEEKKSPTHKVDCYKNRVALELEWNNKDPFFDRDLNNFRLLFDLRAISVGIIITRTDELQNVFDGLYDAKGRCIGPKYGPSTTHMGKLLPRIQGGGGGGCPILVLGIKPSLYVEEL
ncbi:MAG TPA: BglII/BstYI family type II restriction endonuclease [Bryobacteraceae bacterium]|jgi:hypothetical protein|nr:BglII/BstYI family type II restriction endonuclease [Bryobacteraceae bacterium]